MSSKYYQAENVGNRLIAGQRFEIVEIFAGTAIGVFEATDDKVIADIDAVVLDKSSGVLEISKADYDTFRKKKLTSLNSFPHTNRSTQVSLAARVGVVVAGPVEQVPGDSAKLESVDKALEGVGAVPPPPDAPPVAQPTAEPPAEQAT